VFRPRSPRPSAIRLLVPATAVIALLVGCGSSAPPAGTSVDTTGSAAGEAVGGAVAVVATTNVYASVVSTIGGDKVTVSAILDNPSADPHSFEAAPKDQVKIAHAQLVIANGGGYDDFAQQMIDAADPKPQLIDAVQVSGLQKPTDTAFNEHVFYHSAAMARLGSAIATTLGELDPTNAATFSRNAKEFAGKLSELDRRTAAIKAAHPGVKAVVTEPVADYLLQQTGIADITPSGFAEAIESESDPAAKDIAEIDALLTDKSAGLLVYNEQSTGPVTDRVRATAESAGVPVLAVTETLPAGTTDFLTWRTATIGALEKALG
jgi:zinc/manganese transport system substrate-binding protein